MAENKKHGHEMPNIKHPQAETCIPQEMVIEDVKLAAAYVPFQKMCTHFSPLDGLKAGTIFPELYSPYKGKDKKFKRNWQE